MAIGTPVDLGHNNRTGTFSTVVLTVSASVAAGNKIIVWAGTSNAPGLTATFTDSAGNTWQTDITGSAATPSVAMGSSDIVNALTSGSSTITVTWSASSNNDYFIGACSVSGLAAGIGTATPVTATASSSAWMNATAGNLTTSSSSEILIGMAIRGASTTSTPTAGNTEIQDFNDGSRTLSSVYQIVSPGTAAPGGTWGTSGTWRGVAASYKIAGSATTNKTIAADALVDLATLPKVINKTLVV